MFNHQRLKCYELSLLLAKRLPELISTWPRGYSYLRDQIERALSSILLNTAKGNGRTSLKERAHFFSIARGSAAEVSSIIDVGFAFKVVSEIDFNFFQSNLLSIVKMLYKLK